MTDTNNPPAVTPEKVRALMDELTFLTDKLSTEFPAIKGQANVFCELGGAYIKLHEENARLRTALEKIVNTEELDDIDRFLDETLDELFPTTAEKEPKE